MKFNIFIKLIVEKIDLKIKANDHNTYLPTLLTRSVGKVLTSTITRMMADLSLSELNFQKQREILGREKSCKTEV